MKKIFLLMFLISQYGSYAQTTEKFNKNRLIVKFKPSVRYEIPVNGKKFNHKKLDKTNIENGVQSIILSGNKKQGNTYILNFESNQDIDYLIQQYKNTNLFEYVEPDFIGLGGGKKVELQFTPNDTYFSRQYGLYNDGTFSEYPATDDADIDMELGWDIEQGDQSIIVAVLDSGIKLNHTEFSGRVWTNPNETINGIDDDNNGYIDDIKGWDFANGDNDPTDDHGHGTNVTGIIGANSNNNLGYSGVDWNCKLMIGKILDQNNSGAYSWWTDAIYYAVDNGANVINMSVGGLNFSSSMKDAIDYAYNNDVTVVACMMNYNNNTISYPAGYQNTIAVGSTNPNDERSAPFFWSPTSGSNYGNHIDVVAPGNYIYGLSHQSNTNYNYYWGGTSQAAPLVTGLCSLLLAQDINRTPNDIRSILRDTAEDQVGNVSEDVLGFDIYYGYGRVNAHQALLLSNLSTNEFTNPLKFSILPNPVSNFVTINSNLEFNTVLIHNILGIEILRIENSSRLNSLRIDLTNFDKGVYLTSLLNKNEIVLVSKKIIKL
jgi:subtilisin family serine protease|tara:strand:- start:945 stop:2579 length:1635 start_codon:yes stop_codon:yes gene_type:complete